MARAATSYGRYQVGEAPSALLSLHRHGGAPLRAASHEPKNAVLDQQDLFAQGIRVSQLVPGAKDVDALGSCTANATMSALSLVLDEEDYLAYTHASSYEDAVGVERAAICFYNACTDQTGNPAQEWPPTDCGSSGPYIVSELKAQELVRGECVATDAESLVSLLQDGAVLQGSPWFNAWETPDAHGFIDGTGSAVALEDALRSGVAGGHETLLWAVEPSCTEIGDLNPARTVITGRNSWSSTWGEHGNYRIHLSTLMYLASHCDWRQLVP